mgnify:CR=1 FL=1|tara:strand:+ start:1511 stop:1765 length:255 start_codon:yes stop_codon:yes gene_type:complete
MTLPEIPYDSWFHDKPHPHDIMPIATDEPIDTSPSEIQPPGVDQEEDKTIHEKMYKIATAKYNPFAVGGSESIHDFGGGSELVK